MDTTPVSLLQRLRRQPTAAEWQRFVAIFAPILYRWATRLGAQPADAADLVQDVLITVFQRMPSFEYREGGSFRAWLYVALRNAWATRKKRYERGPALAENLERLPDCKADDDTGAEDYRREVVGRVAALIRGDFEARTWQAVWESVTRDEPVQDVARRHGLTRNALYRARNRVLGRLRAELDGLLS
jgi:RNA polymerase sigma-70 factor (ECF subfamily)